MRFRLFVRSLSLFSKPSKVGGQAVIEGVMMRSPASYSVAVRRKNGNIDCRKMSYSGLTVRFPVLGKPVIRGFIQLFESLVLGFKTLNLSADIAMEDEKISEGKVYKKTWKEEVSNTVVMGFSLLVALGIFMYMPLALSQWIRKDQDPFLFNLLAGAIRIALFMGYLVLISQWKEIQRIFEYHGAEHKSIFMYEAGEAISIDNAKKYTTHHPRCGTSFLIIVAVLYIILFAFIDGLYALLFGPYPTVFHRFLVHLALIPLVSGISYEALKLSDRFKENRIVSLFSRPGLWVQNITTREPQESQLEVAIQALKAVI